jgi:hypothetical protein
LELMIVAGVHLDRAWAHLGIRFGAVLREWSREALARVIDEAHRQSIETLVIAGDLLDRSTALPATVDYAAKVLASFRGTVLIAPGRSDWVGGFGPYDLQEWAANTHIWSAADYQPSPQVPMVWASAWTAPAGSAPRAPDAPGPRVLVRAGMDESDLGRAAIRRDDLLVTTGTAVGESILTVPDLVHDPRVEGGCAVIVDGGDPTKPVRQVELPAQPGGLEELDVTRHESTDALATTLEDAVKKQGPLLLRLVGELAPSVLLPGFGGPELRAGVVLDLDSLRYAQAVPDRSDRSARAEFLRAMASRRTGDLERHQTTAIGLAALDAALQGA